MKEEIREIVLSFGADVCGISGIERFENSRSGFHPTDVFPTCRAVVSFGVSMPKSLMNVNPRLIYSHFNGVAKDKADYIAFHAAKEIERRFSCLALPMPSDTPYEYWDSEKKEGRGLISMKHAAVNAGLGTLGKSTLLINETYGNLLTLGAILLDIELSSDELAKSICIESCRKCIDSCPAGAINPDGTVNQLLCRENTYKKTTRGFNTAECDNCRSICPMKYGKK